MQNLGEILLKDKIITKEELKKALALQKKTNQRLDRVLLELKFLTPKEILQVLSEKLHISYLDHIPDEDIDSEGLSKLSHSFLKRSCLLPLKGERVATSDPLDPGPIDNLRLILAHPLKMVIVSEEEILKEIERGYGAKETESATEIIKEFEKVDFGKGEGVSEGAEDLLDLASKPPIIKFVDSLIIEALKKRASDIHIEPFEKELRIRYRIDGVLYDILRNERSHQPAIVSRVKVMAGLNIAERRLPQDGRISIKMAGKEIDIRVSVIPTFFGERVVMRLLDKSSMSFRLENLGFFQKNLERFLKFIKSSHGIILNTGPTGSGKTTTLYSALSKINTPDKNIITVEDPIEYQLEGIGQIQVKPKIGLTFASGLRSIVRQDPDIMMVGEIRDFETAEIAIHAALTGHLVFSTLHTNDAAGAITRLLEMGVEPYLASSSVIGIMAQRLVRRICPKCKESYTPTPESLSEVGLKPSDLKEGILWRGKGCPSCLNTGYLGRTGIFELLAIDDEIRDMITNKKEANLIKEKAVSKGMTTLQQAGVEKVLAGITTLEEVLRVTQEIVV
jgi:general secretion pathway protein E